MSPDRKSEVRGRRSENQRRDPASSPPTPHPIPPPPAPTPAPPLLRTLTIALVALCCTVALAPHAVSASPSHDVLVVAGAPGGPEFAAGFARAAGQWREACAAAGSSHTMVGLDPEGTPPPGPDSSADREAIAAWFASLDPASPRPVWFVYLGHGTWDGREARLNLRGADLTGTELKRLLAPLRSRPVVIIHGGSASGPLIPLLTGPQRIVITATSSGDEVNYARFGERFAAVVGAPAAEGNGDLDRDGQVSVLEAFVAAGRGVELFYAGEGRLATEHALLEDNGDGRGTPAEFFRGARLVRQAADKTAPDGMLARRIALVETSEERALTADQRARRDALEDELEALRAQRSSLPEPEYLRRLEPILRRLAALYGEVPVDS